MEKERIERWKARPPSVQSPEVDEDELLPMPMGRSRGMDSASSSRSGTASGLNGLPRGGTADSSANSSRRNSKEDTRDFAGERHGDLMIQNIEDGESAG